MSTGDGFESGSVESAGSGTVASVDKFNAVDSVKDVAKIRTMASSLHAMNGTPKRVRPDKFKMYESQIFSLFKATTEEAKESVRYALTYIGVVYGTGTNVDTREIFVKPEGLDGKSANLYVCDIVGQNYYRRFMANYSERAIAMVRASPEMKAALAERCVRNGIPTTDVEAGIDFLDAGSGVTDRVLAVRTRNKYAALARTNNQGMTGQQRSALSASNALHRFHDDDVESLAADA